MVKKKTAKKRVSKSSKPVLTSPWKIGLLVSLLLVLVSLGVGGYFVYTYRIQLSWIAIGPSGWSFDSYGFFREMYPLAAVVTIISLVAYFAVVSAVRRYRCYLDSGQDYRKMISLAQSIDDLTNPAEIARLSAYPELQGVLRNYGDQIREISQDIGRGQELLGFEEFDGDVEALLGDEALPGTVLGSKPYAKAFRRIVERLAADGARMDELAKQSETDRRALGRAALACGRVVEAAGGIGEELMELAKTASELDRVANELDARAPLAGAEHGPKPDAWKGAGADVEGAARKLEDGKTLLQELSDENNSVAIALALMAARGPADGQELAAFADRVRITAERFHKLGAVVGLVAKQLLGACYALKETAPQAAAANPPAGLDDRSRRAIVEIAGEIERRSARLGNLICSLGSDLHDAQELLQRDFTNQPPAGPETPTAFDEHVPAAEAPAASKSSSDSSAFVIDRGSTWSGMPGTASEPAERVEEPPAEMDPAASSEPESETPPAQEETTNAADFSDMSSLRDLDGERPSGKRASVPEPRPAEEEGASGQEQRPAAEERAGEPTAPPAAEGGWMEMPGHRWLKIDVEKNEPDDDRAVDVKVESPAPNEAPRRAAEPEDGTESDPIHDLVALGAVEYVEEVEAER
jgi:hypothetical protein